MPFPRLLAPVAGLLALIAAGCGGAAGGGVAGGGPSPAPSRAPVRAPASTAAAANVDWPTFDHDPARTGVLNRSTGITAANAHRLRRRTIALPGTVDSSPIYLHAVRVAGARRDVFVMTTTYGRTVAVDAGSGRLLWTYTPPGYGSWVGSYRITNASPVADSDRAHVFAVSPDGLIHKLDLSDGSEVGGRWPVRITLLPAREKVTSSLTLARGRLMASTGGYIGDAPPYQGHVVTIDPRSGRIFTVFNTLCSNVHRLMHPSNCPASDSAIWSRSGVTIEPNGRMLLATGNAPFNGRTDWGDSVLELSADARRLVQSYTPTDQASLGPSDTDLGSSGPALIGGGSALQVGKDGRLRVLSLARLNGRDRRLGRLGGERQVLSAPGGAGVFTAPAVWRHGRSTTVFVADGSATAAYAVRGGRLHRTWSSNAGGTSPIVAGGLLYVYDPSGVLIVRRPGSGRIVAQLPAGSGHWQSPVIGGRRIALPQGDANDHAASGTLNLYTLG